MRKIIFILLFTPLITFAQNETNKPQTKFEQLASKTGRILKFVDVKMPRLSYLESSIRIIMDEQFNRYFYRIEKTETSTSLSDIVAIEYSDIVAIEYSDLVEINKALEKLQKEVDNDCASNPDYLENKFITEDGFRIGYYVDRGKPNWFIKLTTYDKSVVFIKKEVLAEQFPAAQRKIEELKASYGK